MKLFQFNRSLFQRDPRISPQIQTHVRIKRRNNSYLHGIYESVSTETKNIVRESNLSVLL